VNGHQGTPAGNAAPSIITTTLKDVEKQLAHALGDGSLNSIEYTHRSSTAINAWCQASIVRYREKSFFRYPTDGREAEFGIFYFGLPHSARCGGTC
jgi:hypothetical protein